MPRVLNRHVHGIPDHAVFVGRPTDLGNPFVVGTRDENVAEYRTYATEKMKIDPEFAALVRELRGRDLVCYCAPAPCHADVLVELANDG